MLITNPRNIKLRPDDVDLLVEIEKQSGLPDGFWNDVRLTSAFRPSDSFGYHKLGLAVDIACNTLSKMRHIYDALVANNWQGGLGIAGPGLPLHIHVDSRHLIGHATAYFIEWLAGPNQYIYPTKQKNEKHFEQCYLTVRRLYG